VGKTIIIDLEAPKVLRVLVRPHRHLAESTGVSNGEAYHLAHWKDSRATATRYLDELAEEGLLDKHKLGRENYYVNVSLLTYFLIWLTYITNESVFYKMAIILAIALPWRSGWYRRV